jgi:hypothetical protein
VLGNANTSALLDFVEDWSKGHKQGLFGDLSHRLPVLRAFEREYGKK